MYDCASGGVPLSSAASKARDDAYRETSRSNVLTTALQENVHALDLNMNSGYSLYSQVGSAGQLWRGAGGSTRPSGSILLLPPPAPPSSPLQLLLYNIIHPYKSFI